MSKPRLSSGRIPFQLGIGASEPTPTELPYQGDAYYYDSGAGIGSIAGGTVLSGPNQDSPIGSVTGGTILPPDQIYD